MESRIPDGFKLGHYNDEHTGVSVILCDGAVGGVDVRGCAPGTRETDLLRAEKAIEEVHAVALCGGSSYGLQACCGIMEWLREKGVGYKMGDKIVPLVAGAVIYDLKGDSYHYPDMNAGKAACDNASDRPIRGKVGAGKGATVGKIRGDAFASEGGLGIATVAVGAATVTAVVVVNACGDVRDADSGKILAGAKANDGSFIDTAGCIVNNDFMKLMKGGNTTIGCIMTDAKLTKLQANKIATLAHDGMARAIRPVHTDFDGDTLFALSSNKVDAQFMAVGVAVEEAVARAIADAVRK
jgi:L-aminopeptidase/D-esterase-like protein